MGILEMPVAQVVVVLIAFCGAVAGLGKLMFSQFEKRMAERFRAHDETLARFLDDQSGGIKKINELEREFLIFRGDMPNHYVRRDDFIRNQTVIEAKLDAISSRVENLQLRGQTHHG